MHPHNHSQYYDSISSGYDELHGDEQRRKLSIIKDNLAVPKDSRLLDIGCGTGVSLEFFDCEWHGIEPSDGLLEVLRKKGVVPDELLVKDAAENITAHFSKNYFDFAICVTAAHHIHEFGVFIENLKTVCKEEARFAFSLLKRTSNFENLVSELKHRLVCIKEIDEGKDLILVLQKQKL